MWKIYIKNPLKSTKTAKLMQNTQKKQKKYLLKWYKMCYYVVVN